MDEAIYRLNVPIAFRYRTNAIDAHTVKVALIVRHANLAVSHRTDLKLLVCLGESSREISLLILCAVQDAVKHEHGPYAVEGFLIGESVPVGLGYDTFYHERVEILLDGLVRRREYSVVAIRGHELIDRCLADVAHGLLLHEPHVFAKLGMVFQIACHRTFPEDISG